MVNIWFENDWIWSQGIFDVSRLFQINHPHIPTVASYLQGVPFLLPFIFDAWLAIRVGSSFEIQIKPDASLPATTLLSATSSSQQIIRNEREINLLSLWDIKKRQTRRGKVRKRKTNIHSPILPPHPPSLQPGFVLSLLHRCGLAAIRELLRRTKGKIRRAERKKNTKLPKQITATGDFSSLSSLEDWEKWKLGWPTAHTGLRQWEKRTNKDGYSWLTSHLKSMSNCWKL